MVWGFYGRGAELDELASILRRRRWFFARITGRRRIGKTTLIQQALEAASFGTCKRAAAKLVTDLPNFDGHVERFLDAHPDLRAWTVQRVAIAPTLDGAARRAVAEAGVIPQSLDDLLTGLPA